MADMFEQHETRARINALEKLESDICALEQSIAREYDNGLGTVEDRNELNALNNELRDIYIQITNLQSKQK